MKEILEDNLIPIVMVGILIAIAIGDTIINLIN
jgi:hypothetical protein